MSLNVTAAAHYTSFDETYANIDFSSLNWLEKKWAAWYILIGNPVIATGLMSFLLHEVGLVLSTHGCIPSSLFCSRFQVVYFGRAVPWIIIDAIPYFRKWKLQPNKIPTPQEQWECTKLVLFSHFTIELPLVRVTQFRPLFHAAHCISTLDLVVPPGRRVYWNDYIPSTPAIMPSNASSNRVFLLF
jgi:methylsterol monooxygenase